MELIQLIIFFIETDSQPPSRILLYEEPTWSLLHSFIRPLKALSESCRVLRALTFPVLFSLLQADASNVTGLLVFTEQYGLRGQGVNVLISSCKNEDMQANMTLVPDQNMDVKGIFQVMEAINPEVLTVVLPPAIMSDLFCYQLQLQHGWVFKIPYQVLRFKQDLFIPSRSVEPDSQSENDIFGLRPWTECTFNEGSSVPAYSTYEYFHLLVPSRLLPSDRSQMQRSAARLDKLKSFDLIGVFPFNHMPTTCSFLSSLPKLERLRIQLAPSVNRSRDVLDYSSALGPCQPQDLWMEWEQNYTLLNHSLRKDLFLSLTEFTVLDYSVEGLHMMIYACVGRGLLDWRHDGNGSWTRILDQK